MFGPEGVILAVSSCLKQNMPGKLAEFRTRYNVLDGSLPDVVRYLTTEPPDIALDRPPMIVVVEQDSDNINGAVKRSADGAGGSVYEFRYTLGIFVWARGNTFETTGLARQRYGLAVREVLLQTRGVGGGGDPGSIVIDPLTMTETYSGVAAGGPSREIIAGTAITVQYRAQEWLGPVLLGVPVTGVVPVIGVEPH